MFQRVLIAVLGTSLLIQNFATAATAPVTTLQTQNPDVSSTLVTQPLNSIVPPSLKPKIDPKTKGRSQPKLLTAVTDSQNRVIGWTEAPKPSQQDQVQEINTRNAQWKESHAQAKPFIPGLIKPDFTQQGAMMRIQQRVSEINDNDLMSRFKNELKAQSQAKGAVQGLFLKRLGINPQHSDYEHDQISFQGHMIYLNNKAQNMSLSMNVSELLSSDVPGEVVGVSDNYIYAKIGSENGARLLRIDARNPAQGWDTLDLGGTFRGMALFGSQMLVVVEGVGLVTYKDENSIPAVGQQIPREEEAKFNRVTVQKLGDNHFLPGGVQAFNEEMLSMKIVGSVVGHKQGLIIFADKLVYRIDLKTGQTTIYNQAHFFSPNPSEPLEIRPWSRINEDNTELRTTEWKPSRVRVLQIVSIKDQMALAYISNSGRTELVLARLVSGPSQRKVTRLSEAGQVNGFLTRGDMIFILKTGEISAYRLDDSNTQFLKVGSIPTRDSSGRPVENVSARFDKNSLQTFDRDGHHLVTVELSEPYKPVPLLFGFCNAWLSGVNKLIGASEALR